MVLTRLLYWFVLLTIKTDRNLPRTSFWMCRLTFFFETPNNIQAALKLSRLVLSALCKQTFWTSKKAIIFLVKEQCLIFFFQFSYFSHVSDALCFRLFGTFGSCTREIVGNISSDIEKSFSQLLQNEKKELNIVFVKTVICLYVIFSLHIIRERSFILLYSFTDFVKMVRHKRLNIGCSPSICASIISKLQWFSPV